MPNRCPPVRPTRVALFALALLAAHAAHAEEVIYGPDGAPTVVQRKLYPMTGRWELGLGALASTNTALVNHYGGLLSLSYHPNEWLDLGGDLLGNYTALSGLSQQIRDKLPPRGDTNVKPPRPNFASEVANADQLRFGAMVAARMAPIYGKLNLASELDVHFQAYLLAGAGVGLIKHDSVNLCARASFTACSTGDGSSAANSTPADFQVSNSLKPLGELGLGFRFYLSNRASLRAEVRGFVFPASYQAASDLTNPASGTPKSYLAIIASVLFGLSVNL